MSLEILAQLSRFYGNNPEYILAGGGNTSWKDEDTLFVKASGFSLAEATEDSFVKMDRNSLSLILNKTYPESNAERESAVLADMMASRKAGEEHKRPSVEALLHDIIPFSFVVHLHPALVNGLTCSVNGEKAVREIFGEDVIWIPSIDPGYILSIEVKKAIDQFYSKKKKYAEVIFLQNHGIFVGADNADNIKKQYDKIISKISAKNKWKPDFSDEKRENISSLSGQTADIARILSELDEEAKVTAFLSGAEFAAFLKNRSSFIPLSSAYTPDHIVYAGSDPLFTEQQTAEGIRKDWENHVKKTGRNPKIVAVQGIGVFGLGKSEKAVGFTLDLFKDSVKIAVYTENFGGPLFMTSDKIEFINNWEVERFRSDVSTK